MHDDLSAHVSAQVRAAPVRHLSLMPSSDAEADRHAALLSRWHGVRGVSLLRWVEWEGSGSGLRVLQAPRREDASDAAIDGANTALRSLAIGVFALSSGTIDRLGR